MLSLSWVFNDNYGAESVGYIIILSEIYEDLHCLHLESRDDITFPMRFVISQTYDILWHYNRHALLVKSSVRDLSCNTTT